MSNLDQSVTFWIEKLKSGHDRAAEELWARYGNKLIDMARRKFGTIPRRVADEQDVANSVFRSLCLGAQKGNFDRLKDRNDLWNLLIAISQQKVVDQIRRQTARKRGGGVKTVDDAMYDLDLVPGMVHTADFLAQMDEEHERLLSMLRNDELRQVALWRLEGFSNVDIGAKLGIKTRSVERKFELIRDTWREEYYKKSHPK